MWRAQRGDTHALRWACIRQICSERSFFRREGGGGTGILLFSSPSSFLLTFRRAYREIIIQKICFHAGKQGKAARFKTLFFLPHSKALNESILLLAPGWQPPISSTPFEADGLDEAAGSVPGEGPGWVPLGKGRVRAGLPEGTNNLSFPSSKLPP